MGGEGIGEQVMGNITANELAGFGVGTLLLCATIAAPKIDSLISSSQRSSLGMCKRCGDVKLIACRRCKGIGLVKPGGLFGLNLLSDLYESTGRTDSNVRFLAVEEGEEVGIKDVFILGCG
ncbi:hypothetical protein Dimus_034171 [Dionaea muscipula]